jgi:hypothetical protein
VLQTASTRETPCPKVGSTPWRGREEIQGALLLFCHFGGVALNSTQPQKTYVVGFASLRLPISFFSSSATFRISPAEAGGSSPISGS